MSEATSRRQTNENDAPKRLGQQRERVVAVVEEEQHRALVEFVGERLDERHVVGEDLLVAKVKREANDGVDVVVAEQVKDRLLVLDVLDQHAVQRAAVRM